MINPDALIKAEALVEAHQYIRRFAGKTIVVKVGGSIMDDEQALRKLLVDVGFMHAVGMRPIVVHGGGKAITEAMQQAGLEAQFVQGRRYTDERTLAIAEHVLVNQINKWIVEEITNAGAPAMGLHSLSSCVVFGEKLFLDPPADDAGGAGRKIDIGLVGRVKRVNQELLAALLDAGHVPVIAPIARDGSGGKLNINADSVAGHVAAALKAEKLVLVSDTHGIRTTDAPDSLASQLTEDEIKQLIRSGVIAAGMLPKVEACITALEAGVTRTHIVDGRVSHSLMLEVYTDRGIGTMIVL